MSQKNVKRKAKDSVFTCLFSEPEYTFKLYQALHPEDQETTVEDIEHITIENIMVDDLYNDLGFSVNDRLIVLVEAQSTWNENIIIRSALYMARTYQDYFNQHGISLYDQKVKHLPQPEIYVLYTKKERPIKVLTLKNAFFNGQDTAIDVKVKILYGMPEDDIIGQYVLFTKVLDEQVKIHGRTKMAIQETIQICIDKNILKSWLESRKGEVMDIYDYLYDEEIVRKNHEAFICREAEAKKQNIIATNLILQGNLTHSQIAEVTGLSIDKINELRQNHFE